VLLALGIEHAMRMRHIGIAARPVLPHFSTSSHESHDFRKKKKSF
jgi:hypothetical protein